MKSEFCICCGQKLPQPARNPQQNLLPIKDTRWEKEYDEGYQSGLNWDANWIPGGPHEFPGQKGRNDAYLSGWRNGLNERLRTNKRFQRWWRANRTCQGLKRYKEPDSDEE